MKWLFRLYTRKDGVASQRELGSHICTDEDFSKFYPIEGYQESILEDIKRDPERGFFCIDEDEDLELELYGRENYENY